jgi:putative lipoic acid-binding regulatory protein
MRKMIHYAPSQDEIHKYHMQKSSDGTYDNYRITLAMTTETQKEHLSRRYGIALRILEDEPFLILSVIKED